MSDEPAVPPETNWADYIDALRPFQPPTSRLARKQRLLDEPQPANASRLQSTAAPWWQPETPGKPRT